MLSRQPAAIEPGKYTVVLEPAALGRSPWRSWSSRADARQADEGRSFFSKKGGGNRIGEQVLGEKVHHLFGSGGPAGADADVRCRRAADQAHHLGARRASGRT